MPLGGGGGGGGQAGGIRAGAAYIELGVKDDNLLKGLQDAERKFNAVGARLAKVGGALTLGGLGVAGSLIGGASETLSDLAKLNAAAKAFGTSGQKLSGLFGGLKSVGGEFKEDLEGIIQFRGKLDDALSGAAGEGTKLFAGLSVSAQSLVDKPIEEKFLAVIAAIRQLPQDEQLGRLALVGGTDSVKKWVGILALSNEEFRERARLSEKTQADLDAATKGAAAYAKASAAIQRVWEQIAIGVAPAILFLGAALEKTLAPVLEWLRTNRELATVIVLVGIGMVALGGLLLAAALGFKVLAVVAGSTAAIIQFSYAAAWATIFAPAAIGVALVAAALGGLGYVFVTQTEAGGAFSSKVSGYFAETAANAKAAWGGIGTAIRGNDFGLALSIGLKGLHIEFERFSQVVSGVWDGIGRGWSQLCADMKYLFKSVVIEIDEFFSSSMLAVFKSVFGMFEQQSRRALNLLSQAFAAFGDETTARNLRIVANAPTAMINGAFDSVGDKNAKEIQQKRNEAQKELQAEQDRLARAGLFQDGVNLLRIKKLQDDLAALNGQAAALIVAPDDNKKAQQKQAQLGAAVGLFNTGGFATQAFGNRTVDAIPNLQLKQMLKHTDLLGLAVGYLGELVQKPGLKFGA